MTPLKASRFLDSGEAVISDNQFGEGLSIYSMTINSRAALLFSRCSPSFSSALKTFGAFGRLRSTPIWAGVIPDLLSNVVKKLSSTRNSKTILNRGAQGVPAGGTSIKQLISG